MIDRGEVKVVGATESLPKRAVISALITVFYHDKPIPVAKKNAKQWLRDNNLGKKSDRIPAEELFKLIYKRSPVAVRRVADALKVTFDVRQTRGSSVTMGALIDPPRQIERYERGLISCEEAVQLLAKEVDELRDEKWRLGSEIEKLHRVQARCEELTAENKRLKHGRRT